MCSYCGCGSRNCLVSFSPRRDRRHRPVPLRHAGPAELELGPDDTASASSFGMRRPRGLAADYEGWPPRCPARRTVRSAPDGIDALERYMQPRHSSMTTQLPNGTIAAGIIVSDTPTKQGAPVHPPRIAPSPARTAATALASAATVDLAAAGR